jgi:hypothetical protein
MVLFLSAPCLEFIPTQSSIRFLSANRGTNVPLVRFGSVAMDFSRTPVKLHIELTMHSEKLGKIELVLKRYASLIPVFT